MDISTLDTILKSYPKYRQVQAKKAIYQNLIEDWAEASNLPLELRSRLNKACPLTIDAEISNSKNQKTTKVRLKLNDGLSIESVLMRHKDGRNVVCVSSQVGCPLGCKFCATGKMGFKRNLQAQEIIEQVLYFARMLKKENQRINGVVFMGMGEPFLNYDQVIKSIRFLNQPETFGIGARHISISTVGITEGIQKLTKESLQLNLAISLHAPNNQLRSQIMPINRKYPLEIIFREVDNYLKKTKRKVMFEYLLINKFNDSEECAYQVAILMKKKLYLLNLVNYNPTSQFQPSSPASVNHFKQILTKQKINYTQRYSFGQDINAACGQLLTGNRTILTPSSCKFQKQMQSQA